MYILNINSLKWCLFTLYTAKKKFMLQKWTVLKLYLLSPFLILQPQTQQNTWKYFSGLNMCIHQRLDQIKIKLVKKGDVSRLRNHFAFVHRRTLLSNRCTVDFFLIQEHSWLLVFSRKHIHPLWVSPSSTETLFSPK